MEIHIVQHGLTGLQSHYYNETIAWRDAIADAGFGWHCYANIKLTKAHARQTGAIPAFRLPTDPILETDPRLAPLSDYIDAAESFATDCARALTPVVKPDDIVLIPYASEQEVFGIAKWLDTIPAPVRPRIAIIVHRPDFRWDISEDRTAFNGDITYWRYAGRRLAMATGDRTPFFGVRDARLVGILGIVTGMTTDQVPMSTFTRKTPLASRKTVKEFDLGMVGQFRWERGSDGIPEILASLAARHPHARFLLQVATSAERDSVLDLFAAHPASLEVIAGNQSREQFFRSIFRCRMLVLPYAPHRYRMRTSGILSFATGFGVPVIVPAGTWMSDRIEDGTASGFVYKDLTPDALEPILTQPQAERNALQRKAETLAEPWRRRNSTHTVLNRILDWSRAQDSRT